MQKTIIIYILLCAIDMFANAQTQTIVLRDTVGDFVFDALLTEGVIPQKNIDLVKYFKYIGADTVKINNTRTLDKRVVINYPSEQILQQDSIYSFVFSFSLQDWYGYFGNTPNINFSNEQQIRLRFQIFIDTLYANSSKFKIEPITNFPPCECTKSAERYLGRRNYLPCEEIRDITKWKAWGNEIVCDDVFFYDLLSDGSFYSQESYYQFTAEAHKPLKLTLPEFAINFNPSNCNMKKIIFIKNFINFQLYTHNFATCNK